MKTGPHPASWIEGSGSALTPHSALRADLLHKGGGERRLSYFDERRPSSPSPLVGGGTGWGFTAPASNAGAGALTK